MKLALDPYMFREAPLLELPALVAELGFEWIELSPRDDFIPFYATELSAPLAGQPHLCRPILGVINRRLHMLVFTMRGDVRRKILSRKADWKEVGAMMKKLEPPPADVDESPE